MSGTDLVLRLSGTGMPDGEIELDALGRISLSLQELTTRIGRFVVGQSGPGRTPDVAARVVTLRLTGLAAGSTELRLSFGEPDVLVPGAVEPEVTARLWDVVEGVERNQAPAWVTPLVAESALKTVDALTSAADAVEVRRADGRRARWLREAVQRETWQLPRLTEAGEPVTVSGRLEKVDLADRRFRIRDDVGNRIHLDDVVDAEGVAALVGRRTVATGRGQYDARGVLRGLVGATLAQHDLPAAWTARRTTDYEELIRSAPGPDPRGIPGLTVDEIDAFLAALRD